MFDSIAGITIRYFRLVSLAELIVYFSFQSHSDVFTLIYIYNIKNVYFLYIIFIFLVTLLYQICTTIFMLTQYCETGLFQSL